jgi:hypothetical protein
VAVDISEVLKQKKDGDVESAIFHLVLKAVAGLKEVSLSWKQYGYYCGVGKRKSIVNKLWNLQMYRIPLC